MTTGSKASKLRGRLSINPDEVPSPATHTRPVAPVAAPILALSEDAPPAEPEPAETPAPAVEPGPEPPSATTPAEPAREKRVNALDDPTILAGRRDYRSFYVEDATFARFRAAIYWLSRREDAAGQVPDNMSAAIEDFMAATAEDLEKRYNDGQPFRMPPGQRRRRSTSKK
jgi:hypothetical protein